MSGTTYVEPSDITDINNRLERIYGKVDNKAKFRIIWSESQTEYRKVEAQNGIILPRAETRFVKKYSYLKDLWVLEQWIPHYGSSELITVEGGSYEPVWAFRDSKGNTQRPVWLAVELLVKAATLGLSGQKEDIKDLTSADQKAFNKEIEMFEDLLADQGTNYGNQTDAFVKPVYQEASKQKMRES